jgi:hypothetical protein
MAFDWQGMLLILSLLSMIAGNVIAISQTEHQADAGVLDRSPAWATC